MRQTLALALLALAACGSQNNDGTWTYTSELYDSSGTCTGAPQTTAGVFTVTGNVVDYNGAYYALDPNGDADWTTNQPQAQGNCTGNAKHDVWLQLEYGTGRDTATLTFNCSGATSECILGYNLTLAKQ